MGDAARARAGDMIFVPHLRFLLSCCVNACVLHLDFDSDFGPDFDFDFDFVGGDGNDENEKVGRRVKVHS